MKLAWLLLICSGCIPDANADANPAYRTTFKFDVRFSGSTMTYNENQDTVVDVPLPSNQGWQCKRLSPSVVDERVRGSFLCSSDNWKTDVVTMIGCRKEAIDPPKIVAMRLHAPKANGLPQGITDPDAGTDAFAFGKWIDLTITCETKAGK